MSKIKNVNKVSVIEGITGYMIGEKVFNERAGIDVYECIECDFKTHDEAVRRMQELVYAHAALKANNCQYENIDTQDYGVIWHMQEAKRKKNRETNTSQLDILEMYKLKGFVISVTDYANNLFETIYAHEDMMKLLVKTFYDNHEHGDTLLVHELGKTLYMEGIYK